MKKVLCLALSFVMLLSVSSPAFAANVSEMTVQEASEYVALSFMQNSLDEDVEISATTPL